MFFQLKSPHRVGDEQSDALFNGLAQFVDDEVIAATDIVCASNVFEVQCEVPSLSYMMNRYELDISTYNGHRIDNFLVYALDSLITCDGKKRKSKMATKRTLALSIICALLRDIEALPFDEAERILDSLVFITSISIVHEAIASLCQEDSDDVPKNVLLSLWIAFMLSYTKSSKTLNVLPEAVGLLGDNITMATLYVNRHSESVLRRWLTDIDRKHYSIAHDLFASINLTPEQFGSTLIVLARGYALFHALMFALISNARFGQQGQFLSDVARALVKYADKRVIQSEGDPNLGRAVGFRFNCAMRELAFYDDVEPLKICNIDFHKERFLGKLALKVALYFSARTVASYLREYDICLSNLRDKSCLQYPTLKQIRNRSALVHIILDAHADSTGEINVGALIDTIKHSSSTIRPYVADVLSHVDEDEFLSHVTTTPLLKTYVEVKGLQGIDVIGKLKNNPLRKKLMKAMFT